MRAWLLILVVLLCFLLLSCGKTTVSTSGAENTDDAESTVQAAASTQAPADANQITLTDCAAASGEIFSTALSVEGTVDFCALDLKIFYDADKLTFVAFEDLNEDVVANCNGEGTVFVNFLRANNVTKKTELCNIKFEAKTDEICETVFRIEPTEMVRLDAADEIERCACTVKKGVVSLNGGGADAG